MFTNLSESNNPNIPSDLNLQTSCDSAQYLNCVQTNRRATNYGFELHFVTS